MSEQAPIGYAVVVAQNLGDGRNASFQFNFAYGATAAEMDVEMDKITAVLNRQAARSELDPRRRELKQQKLIAEVITKDIMDMEAKTSQPRDPARRNQTNVVQLRQTIDAQKGALDKTKRTIEELEKIIADLEQKAA